MRDFLEHHQGIKHRLTAAESRFEDSSSVGDISAASLNETATSSSGIHSFGPAACVAFSNDGARMAVGSGRGGQTNMGITIWSMVGGVPQKGPARLKVGAAVSAMAFSPDGRLLASGADELQPLHPDDNAVLIWGEDQPGYFDAEGVVVGMHWVYMWKLNIDGPVCSLAFWNSDRFLLIAISAMKSETVNQDYVCGHIELWSIEDLAESAMHKANSPRRRVDAREKKDFEKRTVTSCALSPAHEWLIVGTAEDVPLTTGFKVGSVSIFPADPVSWHDKSRENRLYVSHEVRAVAWCPAGQWVAVANGAQVNVWHSTVLLRENEDEAARPKLARKAKASTPTLEGRTFAEDRAMKTMSPSPNGDSMVGGRPTSQDSGDNEAARPRPARKFKACLLTSKGRTIAADRALKTISFSPDGHSIVAGGTASQGCDGTVTMWDLETGGIARQWRCPGNIKVVQFAPKAPVLVVASGIEENVGLLRLDGGPYQCMCVIPSHAQATFQRSAASPLSPRYATTMNRLKPQLLEMMGTGTGEFVASTMLKKRKQQQQQACVAISENGAFVAVAMLRDRRSGQITIFKIGAGTSIVGVLEWQDALPVDLALHVPLSSHSIGGVCHRKTVSDYKREGNMHRDPGHDQSRAMLERDSHLAMVALLTSRGLMLWNLETCRLLCDDIEVPGPTCIAFSPDGNLLAIGGRGYSRDIHNITIVPLTTPLSARAHPHNPCFGRDAANYTVNAMAFSGKSQHLAVAGDQMLAVFFVSDAGQWQQQATIPLNAAIGLRRSPVSALAFSPSVSSASEAVQLAGASLLSITVWSIGPQTGMFDILDEIPLRKASPQPNDDSSSDEEPLPDPLDDPDSCENNRVRGRAKTFVRLKFSPSGRSLALVAAHRLVVCAHHYEQNTVFGEWAVLQDLRFGGCVVDVHFDQAKEAHYDLRPRSAVVQVNGDEGDDQYTMTASGGIVGSGSGVYIIYDLHEYSLKFHLADLQHLVDKFGSRAFRARVDALPAMLHQRLFPQELGWTLFHFAAYKGNLAIVQVLLQRWVAKGDGASPFVLDLRGQNALDCALACRHFNIIDEILMAAVEAPKMLRDVLPDSHVALTQTVVRLLRHPVSALPKFLDLACMQEPCNHLPPSMAAGTERYPLRSATSATTLLNQETCALIAPTSHRDNDSAQPIKVRVLLLRGALDRELGLVKALCDTNNHTVLETQVVQMLIRHKWLEYRQHFHHKLWWYICYIGALTVWTLFYYRQDSVSFLDSEEAAPTMSNTTLSDASVSRGHWVFSLTKVCLWVLCLHFLRDELRQLLAAAREAEQLRTGASRLTLRDVAEGLDMYCRDFWNWFDMARIAFVLYILIDDTDANVEVVGIACLLVWLRLMYFFRGFEWTGWLVRSGVEVARGMIPFLAMFVMLWLAFSHCFYILLLEDRFINLPKGEETTFDALVFAYRLVFLGESDVGVEERSRVFQVLFMFSTFTTSVVALNMLIAIMSDAYSRVQRDEIIAKNRELAMLVHDIGVLHRSSNAKRQYLVGAFRKDRVIQNQTSTHTDMDVGMGADELRKNQRALDGGTRQQDHRSLTKVEQSIQTLNRVSEKMDAVVHRVDALERISQNSAIQAGQTQLNVQELRDEFAKLSQRIAEVLPPGVSMPSDDAAPLIS